MRHNGTEIPDSVEAGLRTLVSLLSHISSKSMVFATTAALKEAGIRVRSPDRPPYNRAGIDAKNVASAILQKWRVAGYVSYTPKEGWIVKNPDKMKKGT